MKIYAKRALVHGNWQEDCVVEVEDGMIRSVLQGCGGDLTAEILTPGLFDKHIHGGMDYDCRRPEDAGCERWLRYVLSHGVTNILISVPTETVDKTRAAIAHARRVMDLQAEGKMTGARVMGVHMEGPFLNPENKGAMNGSYMIAPTLENFEALTGENADIIRAITMAPEVPGACELAKVLSARGIRVQAGHTKADYACMEKAQAAGFSGLTHSFNAMPGIHHRDPGPVVYGLVNDGICMEAICDFVHLSAPVVKMMFRTKGAAGIAMVSDSVRTAGMPDGEYVDAVEQSVFVRNGRNYTVTGGIAGSYHQMDTGIANVVGLGIPMEEAVCAGSAVPAKYLGFGDRLGDIAPGMVACLAGWNKDAKCAWGFDGRYAVHAGK